MDKIGEVAVTTITLFGHSFQINPTNIIMTWIVMGLLTLLAYLATRKLTTLPSNTQGITETIYEFIDDLTISSLGKKDGSIFVPFIFMIFTFIAIPSIIFI